MVECGGEVVGTRRVRLLAGTALGGAGRIDEVVRLGRGGSGEVRVASTPVFPSREEAGHEASHDC